LPAPGRLQEGRLMEKIRTARYQLGQVVRHRFYPFRGVIFDIDPEFDNDEEWWMSIPPEIRPAKDQPYYHLLAENAETEYIAYVSEENLLPDDSGEPVRHPQVMEFFDELHDGVYRVRYTQDH
jgi:heat shock protein HspQ